MNYELKIEPSFLLEGINTEELLFQYMETTEGVICSNLSVDFLSCLISDLFKGV